MSRVYLDGTPQRITIGRLKRNAHRMAPQAVDATGMVIEHVVDLGKDTQKRLDDLAHSVKGMKTTTMIVTVIGALALGALIYHLFTKSSAPQRIPRSRQITRRD